MNLFYCIVFFALGVGYWLDISLVGRFGMNEILAFACIPFFLTQRKKVDIPRKPLYLVFAMIALYIAGVLLSDMVNGSQTWLLLRGLTIRRGDDSASPVHGQGTPS